MPRTLVSHMRPTLSYTGRRGHVRWRYWGCLLSSPKSGCTVVARQCDHYYTGPLSSASPSAPLTLTHLVNLDHQATHTVTHCTGYTTTEVTHCPNFEQASAVACQNRLPPLREWNRNRNLSQENHVKSTMIMIFSNRLFAVDWVTWSC